MDDLISRVNRYSMEHTRADTYRQESQGFLERMAQAVRIGGRSCPLLLPPHGGAVVRRTVRGSVGSVGGGPSKPASAAPA